MFYILWSSNLMMWLIGYGLFKNELINLGLFFMVISFLEAVFILSLYNIKREKREKRLNHNLIKNHISLDKGDKENEISLDKKENEINLSKDEKLLDEEKINEDKKENKNNFFDLFDCIQIPSSKSFKDCGDSGDCGDCGDCDCPSP